MGDHARDAAVEVDERVDPDKAVVGAGCGDDRAASALQPVHLAHVRQKARHGAGAGGDVLADLDKVRSEFARDNRDLGAVWPVRDEQFRRQVLAEAPVDFAQAFGRKRVVGQAARVDPALHLDVGDGFKLKVPFLGIGAEVLVQGAFDIDRVGVVALDQVRVVAVH